MHKTTINLNVKLIKKHNQSKNYTLPYMIAHFAVIVNEAEPGNYPNLSLL